MTVTFKKLARILQVQHIPLRFVQDVEIAGKKLTVSESMNDLSFPPKIDRQYFDDVGNGATIGQK